MKRFTSIAFVVAVAIASYGAAHLQNTQTANAQPVSAQQADEPTIKIALLNLEVASRNSKPYKQHKIEWEQTQIQIAAANKKLQEKYRAKLEELKKFPNPDEGDTWLDLRVELQSLEEAMKATKAEQKLYLTALRNDYQTRVIEHVMQEATTYAKKHGYDIVLQEYSVNANEADFFSGNEYVQTMISKPVLITPGVEVNKNAFVTDITDAIR